MIGNDRDANAVRLRGTVVSNPHRLKNGKSTFFVATAVRGANRLLRDVHSVFARALPARVGRGTRVEIRGSLTYRQVFIGRDRDVVPEIVAVEVLVLPSDKTGERQ